MVFTVLICAPTVCDGAARWNVCKSGVQIIDELYVVYCFFIYSIFSRLWLLCVSERDSQVILQVSFFYLCCADNNLFMHLLLSCRMLLSPCLDRVLKGRSIRFLLCFSFFFLVSLSLSRHWILRQCVVSLYTTFFFYILILLCMF